MRLDGERLETRRPRGPFPLRRPRPWAAPVAALLAACSPGPGEPPAPDTPAGSGETPVAPDAGDRDAGDRDADPDLPPTARPDMVEMMRLDQTSERHASDGGGTAWIETESGERARAEVGVPGSWTLVYKAGPLGVADGGMVALLVDPFWNWSTPQTERPDRPGYCEVATDAEGVELEARTLDQTLLGVFVSGGSLAEGDRVHIVYGAGSIGAVPDRYADRRTHFWVRVDGDGDGVSSLVAESPEIDVAPGPAAALWLTLPSTARPGEPARLTVAAVDARANALWDFAGKVLFEDVPESVELEAELVFRPEERGRRTVEVTFAEPGIYQLVGRLVPAGSEDTAAAAAGGGTDGPDAEDAASSPFRALTNPCLVLEDGPRILWGDLHGHSNYSDGTGTPEDFYVYARDVAGLDVAALTDHDHWGVRFLDEHPEMWEELQAVTNRFHEPGRFTTLVAYEWTSWIHGHRHVLYFDDAGEVHSSIDPDHDSPLELWDALRGTDALTFAHHSAGGPIATNWEIPPDPELEPLTEIVSVHGSSEALDSPGVIYSPRPGNFVRDVLDRGYRLGFVGSGDGHDGHPGLAHLMAPGMAGIAAILAEENTRESVLEALRARRCYATNGERILLRTALDGHRMGSTVPAGELADEPTLTFLAVGTTPVEVVEVVRSGEIAVALEVGEERLEVTGQVPLEGLGPGEYVYVRVQQAGRGAAWSSPFYVVE